MKRELSILFSILFYAGLPTACSSDYLNIEVEAPFPMERIKIFVYPDEYFPITDYGAVAGGEAINTGAIAATIEACHEAGGGHVVIPEGVWLTGPVHLRSNVDLHLREGAVLEFSDDPAEYLPEVMTSWEGMECYNYSPLVYAFDCINVAITGPGMLRSRMNTWEEWFGRPQPHLDALRELYTMASTDVPVEERRMGAGGNNMRPHLIHFNRCRGVLLDGFTIRESPFWTIHLYMCAGGVVRGLDVKAHGHNNDGIDLEMSRNFLVEDCLFDQGDDAVVIKSGRNRDAWRLDTPCENIVIRNCRVRAGHTLLGIGSEISSGVRNIYMHDCTVPGSVTNILFIKTNHRRGGFVENIHIKNVEAGRAGCMVGIDTDVLYQWRDLVPTYETRITRIDGIYVDGMWCRSTERVYDLKGDARLPIGRVELRNISAGSVGDIVRRSENVTTLTEENVRVP